MRINAYVDLRDRLSDEEVRRRVDAHLVDLVERLVAADNAEDARFRDWSGFTIGLGLTGAIAYGTWHAWSASGWWTVPLVLVGLVTALAGLVTSIQSLAKQDEGQGS